MIMLFCKEQKFIYYTPVHYNISSEYYFYNCFEAVTNNKLTILSVTSFCHQVTICKEKKLNI